MEFRLYKKLGITNKEIYNIKIQSETIPVNETERNIVNKYTNIDSIIMTTVALKFDSYDKVKKKMTIGKVEDYKFFIGLYEHFGGIPKNIYSYINISPCGKAKIQAMKLRYGKLNIIK